jgi:hypothetical protein
MESAVVASACSRQKIPFGCLRVVSDRIDTLMSPQLVSLLSGPKVSWLGLTALLIRSPFAAADLWRLAKATRLAGRQLAKALGELLTLTLPWGANLE